MSSLVVAVVVASGGLLLGFAICLGGCRRCGPDEINDPPRHESLLALALGDVSDRVLLFPAVRSVP